MGKESARPQGAKPKGASTQNSGNNKRKGRVENLIPHQWGKGQSGNPGGRPKGDLAAEIAQLIFENRENAEDIAQAMLKALKKGNPKVFNALADRAYGKPVQNVKLDANFKGKVIVTSVPRPARG